MMDGANAKHRKGTRGAALSQRALVMSERWFCQGCGVTYPVAPDHPAYGKPCSVCRHRDKRDLYAEIKEGFDALAESREIDRLNDWLATIAVISETHDAARRWAFAALRGDPCGQTAEYGRDDAGSCPKCGHRSI